MSLPVQSLASRAVPEGPEFWTDPCDGPVEGNDPPAPDADLAEQLGLKLALDLNDVDSWKNNYVSRFNTFICKI